MSANKIEFFSLWIIKKFIVSDGHGYAKNFEEFLLANNKIEKLFNTFNNLVNVKRIINFFKHQ